MLGNFEPEPGKGGGAGWFCSAVVTAETGEGRSPPVWVWAPVNPGCVVRTEGGGTEAVGVCTGVLCIVVAGLS